MFHGTGNHVKKRPITRRQHTQDRQVISSPFTMPPVWRLGLEWGQGFTASEISLALSPAGKPRVCRPWHGKHRPCKGKPPVVWAQLAFSEVGGALDAPRLPTVPKLRGERATYTDQTEPLPRLSRI